MNRLLSFMCLFALLGGCMSHQASVKGSSKLNHRSVNEIGEEYFEFTLKNDPFYATYIGDHRFDNLLPNITPAGRKKVSRRLEEFKAELKVIDPRRLGDKDRIRFDFLSHEIETKIGLEDCRFPLWLVDQLEGPQIAFMELAKNHSLQEQKDVVNLLERYRQSHTFFLDHIANLREGRSRGLVAAKINIHHVIDQLDHQLAEDPKMSPFMINADHLPKSLAKQQKSELETEILTTITNIIYPALGAYRDYLKYELLPDARERVGINALALGETCYQNLIERHTGLRKSPQEIHALGLSEVVRIQESMRKLIKDHTDVADEKAFIANLKNSTSQYLKSADELIAHNQALVRRATEALPRAFGILPKTKIEVVALEDYRQKHAPVAYYHEASGDGVRPAYYYLNTYQPERRPLYNMAALAFHEAVPGHHLQISLANENTEIPRFQRHLGQTAFIEGWALYAEILARELELYQGIGEIFGSLNYELWRAVRLVVDTGIHYQGWSRDQAIAYLANNSALTNNEIVNEIDRYIVMPGQALAYKIGQMEFISLRNMCEGKLKDQFSLQAFHDHLLAHGAMPMTTLRNATMRWLDAQTVASNQ